MRQTRVVVAGSANMDLVGTAAFGVTLKARIAAAGVDTSQLRVVYGTSGFALVMVNAEGENVVLVTPGANAAFTGLTEGELAVVRAADVLVAQLEIPVETVTEAALAARAAGTRVVLNASPARRVPGDLLAAVDLLVVNETEARTLTGQGREDPAALLALAPRAVLTLGRDGAWYVERGAAAAHVPAVKVDVVDSTAAGDAFTAALAVAWGEGRDLVDAVRWAAAAGAACTPARRLRGAAPPGRDRRAVRPAGLTARARRGSAGVVGQLLAGRAMPSSVRRAGQRRPAPGSPVLAVLLHRALHRPVDLPEPQGVRRAQQHLLPAVVLHPQLVHPAAPLVRPVEPAQRHLQERDQGQRADRARGQHEQGQRPVAPVLRRPGERHHADQGHQRGQRQQQHQHAPAQHPAPYGECGAAARVPDVRDVRDSDGLAARPDRLGGHLHRVVPVIEGHH
ncbi:hypothetical protein GCM10010429_04150 [Micromonospora olivasterospora]|uniref:Sugar/nucleoside kinase (Ribokinase family) n=1 Tax=Micromonospora olivasterospora TaxID=1880 RepID=A0A562ID52_MICOL|nr:sugar/nucleoside kinase (ribokinase family) [Micromonospora olivasterospora]